MVVPFAAGGAFDVMGRILAVRMSELLGQQVVVENTTGAGGIVGTMRVMNAAPDGYTFLFGSVGTHAYNPTMYKNIRYNAATDFAPVTLFADQPMTLSARKDFPASTMPEFAAHLKANAAKLQYGSAGAGSTTHLACSLVNSTIGVNVTHVPYRGSAPASNDLIGGQIDYMCNNIGSATPLIKGGKVKAIANLSATRSPLMPELATAREQGLKDFEISTWNAIFLPKGTPAAIVKRLGESPTRRWTRRPSRPGCRTSASMASRRTDGRRSIWPGSWSTRSRGGPARSRMPGCRWIEPVRRRCAATPTSTSSAPPTAIRRWRSGPTSPGRRRSMN